MEKVVTTALPANEDYAKAILSIFGEARFRPGQTLSEKQVSEAFQAKKMGRRVDYEDALKYAVEREWLTLQLGMIRLTAAGFAQI
jgi:hypothetical protein